MVAGKGILAFLFAVFATHLANGSTLNSFCHFVQGESSIHGTNVDEKLPIASVSKLITSYWSLLKLGKSHRFVTKVFFKKDTDGSYVIHFKGGSDPYFSKEFLHLVISELNTKGIKSVKELSFDENFKFVWNANSHATAIGDYTPESPTPDDVLKRFSKVKNLTTDYAKTVVAAKDQGINMVPVGQLLVRKFTTDDIELFNGSGNKLTVDGNGNYNSARCSVVLKILIDFENVLKAQGLKFEDIVSVVGADSTSSSSTLYKNETTENSVIAKTGTVSPAILLAGIMSTQKGNVYFMYNMKTNGTRRDWRDAQRKIKTQITSLIQKEYNGGAPISYQSIKFFPFDKDSEKVTYVNQP